ncbi:MAG: hypothetical protein J5674_05100 [Candidatus Methanomethylophilaceae archaeon]|nr:hypothetical protein [Candidatus Methanomethylophilaceae archaeon]
MSASAEKDLGKMLGDPKKAVLAMAIPLMVSYAVAQANGFADASWCSGLGIEASSAVATICPLYWILNGIGAGIGVGASAVVSARLGKNDRRSAQGAARSAVIASLLISLLCIPLMIVLLNPCISWLGADYIGEECRDYIIPIVLLCPMNVLSGTLAGTMRGEGAAKKTMSMTAAGAVTNMVLDPILIYGLGMGLTGAGLATAVSSGVSCVMCAYWYHNGSLVLRLESAGSFRKDSAEVLRAGAPRSAEFFLVYLMSMVQRVLIISGSDATTVALYSMTWMYVSAACVISSAVGAALVPICSAAFAVDDCKKADDAFRRSCWICFLSMSLMALALFVLAEDAVLPFTYSGSMTVLRSDFAAVLRIYCSFIPFIGLIDVCSALLQALGKADVSLASSFARNVVIIVLLAATAEASRDYVFYSLAAAELIGVALMAIPALAYMRRRKAMAFFRHC